jgi:hypothetical protein
VGFIQKNQNSLLFICDYCLKLHSVPQFGVFERTLTIPVAFVAGNFIYCFSAIPDNFTSLFFDNPV